VVKLDLVLVPLGLVEVDGVSGVVTVWHLLRLGVVPNGVHVILYCNMEY
jgi:hypothetical protein